MERKIKFRAWDKKTDIMLEGIELQKLLSYLIFQNCPNSKAYNLMKNHFKDIIWLQFTGLKDKNGKEIYEGDIIGGLINKKVVEVVKFGITRIEDNEMYSDNMVSGFYRQSYEFGKKTNKWHLDNIEKNEVIGNIYENPNLLK